MKILFAASEGVPFCKTGGLADVVGALPEALVSKRHSVRVVLPLYRLIRQSFPKLRLIGKVIQVPFDGRSEPVKIWATTLRPNLTFYFVDAPSFFDRPGIYGETASTFYADNDRRYAFFSRAVLEIAKKVDFQPDIIHVHDWQTGLVPAYLKLLYSKDKFFSKTASVFTIHNLAYQGNFSPASFAMTGLPDSAYSPKTMEFYGHVSFLKAGLVYADAINTVSPTYAKEISTDKNFGCGMEGVLQERAADFDGILNGLDTRFWNPKTDPNLAAPFDLKSLQKRALCKADLQRAAALAENADSPLLGFIGRLDYQKGVDLFIDVAPMALKEGVQIVSLGQGSPSYVRVLAELQKRFPAQVRVRTDFAEPFAHKIYAGVDIFLMPSRFEPCGLSQLIAMRYGAIPVVTPTGGLLDTVQDVSKSGEGTGFVAEDITAVDFFSALSKALRFFKDRENWRALQARAMGRDFSWEKSIQDYLLLYESILR